MVRNLVHQVKFKLEQTGSRASLLGQKCSTQNVKVIPYISLYLYVFLSLPTTYAYPHLYLRGPITYGYC